MVDEVERDGRRPAPKCGHCGSKNVFGISRVVGYFSIINNWNKSKTVEFKHRQRGNYAISN